MKEHLLFICSRNQWRSPTAEQLFKNHANYTAKSAGTSEKARIRLTEKLISWAAIILVMERRHKEIMQAKFAAALTGKRIIILDIADNYQYNDPELIQLLKEQLNRYLEVAL